MCYINLVLKSINVIVNEGLKLGLMDYIARFVIKVLLSNLAISAITVSMTL